MGATDHEAGGGHHVTRRRFLGYVLAAPTLVVAAPLALQLLGEEKAFAAIPSLPQPSDAFDLTDLLFLAAQPTANLIAVQINHDGSASFALPRVESGQGITTSTAMLIAEELDLPVDKVHVTLADARPELLFNQFTAGSSTTTDTYTAIRVAAAIARKNLLQAAAIELGDTVTRLITSAGSILSNSGLSIGYGDLAAKAAATQTRVDSVILKPRSSFTVIGKPQRRVDALAAVTGTKQYTMDLDVAGALPTMICRPPTINGTVRSVDNAPVVKAMPGVTDVTTIEHGVAVRADTFGQCIDAIRALKVTWGPGTVDNLSDDSVHQALKKAQLPFVVPTLGSEVVEAEFTFWWKSNSALEPQTAVADVRDGKATIWSAMQSPILAQEIIAKQLGLPIGSVTCHVTEGGGAFGRRMFVNAPLEAAIISHQIGKPVKLMWDRTAEFRWGRTHPLCISAIRASVEGGNVLTFEQRHTSVATDYTQGFGEVFTDVAAKLPLQNFLEYSQTVFETTTNVPYNFGATTQLLNEIYAYNTFHTGSVRNLYNPDVVAASELMVDQLATKVGKDPYSFRRAFLKDPRAIAALDKAAQVGNWGRSMPQGTAQGIALHGEYKGWTVALVEIDATPATVNRQVHGLGGQDGHAVTGPRVTKVVFVIDVGLAINPLGLQAQMMGGVMDGIAETLTSSEHLVNGNFQEGSWDQYFYTRQWNVPPELEIIVMPPTTGEPGGAGEFGVAASKAAVACAYARATGKLPTSFPINHDGPLQFSDTYPRVPPVPQSPTDGLSYSYGPK